MHQAAIVARLTIPLALWCPGEGSLDLDRVSSNYRSKGCSTSFLVEILGHSFLRPHSEDAVLPLSCFACFPPSHLFLVKRADTSFILAT